MGHKQLSRKDYKILAELDKDARQPLAAIARKVGLSSELTHYRLRNLEKRKVIEGYYSLNNAAALGYTMYRIFFRLQNISKADYSHFIDYLASIKQIGWVASCGGTYDLIIGILTKQQNELYEVLEKVTKDYGRIVRSRDISVNLEMWNYTKKYLQNDHVAEFHFYATERAQVDVLDLKIIKVLSSNAKIPDIELALKVGVSRKVIAYRVKQLKQKNVLLGFRPIISRKALDMEYYKILIKLQQAQDKRVRELLYYTKTHPNVLYTVKVLGTWELEFEVEIENSQKCHEFILEMKHNFSDIINYTEMIQIFEDHKYAFVLE